MRIVSLGLALLLAACAAARFDPAGQADAPYAAAHPYFLEYCALSQIKKRPGFGAEISGEIGGHAVLYLQGACRDPATTYPVLRLCEGDGAGLSVNAHFSNAKWVAIPGRDFFFRGDLMQGTPVTKAAYAAVQARAHELGLYDGVTFHDSVFDDMPRGWSREAWKYEVSLGTDYAIAMARSRYCARVPTDRAAMARIVAFLNAENAPYRAGAVFHWSLFSDNCIHLAHNALAAIGFWARWPTHRPLLVSLFDFPVPRNEFVNIVRRANDALPPTPAAAYDDAAQREALLAFDTFATRPGALAGTVPVMQPNTVYRTDLGLIFYDDPLFGSYQRDSDRILSAPRTTQPDANRRSIADAARAALAARQPLAHWLAQPRYAADKDGFAAVYDRFYAVMARLAAR